MRNYSNLEDEALKQQFLLMFNSLFDLAKPIEWSANMSEVLDTLIHTMHTNEDYYYGDVLFYVRTLEKFFFSIAQIAEKGTSRNG